MGGAGSRVDALAAAPRRRGARAKPPRAPQVNNAIEFDARHRIRPPARRERMASTTSVRALPRARSTRVRARARRAHGRNIRAAAHSTSSIAKLLVTAPEGLSAELERAIDGVVLDCDGVIWHGDRLIPGARAAIESLRARGKRVFFVTNNSTKTREHYAQKLNALGIEASKYEIYTSGYATACYLRSRGLAEIDEGEVERGEHGERLGNDAQRSAYVIGERGLMEELEEAGIDVEAGVYDSVKCSERDWEEMDEWSDENVGAVVVGSDSKFTFAKLAYASLQIQRGAMFVATNPDAGDLVGPGLYPGAGALVNAVATACGKQPEIYCGKPSSFMLELLKDHANIDLSRTLVIGDRLDTDIAFGKAGNAALTALVLTGVTEIDDVNAWAERAETDPAAAAALPDRIVGSLAELCGLEFNPDELCPSLHDSNADVARDEDDMLRAFPAEDAETPEDFPLDEDYGDDDDASNKFSPSGYM